MDATTAALAGGLLGALLGVGAAMVSVRRRPAHDVGPARSPAPAPGPASTGLPAELPPGVIDVLTALRTGSVVLDDSEGIRWASPSAYAWGLLRDGRLVDEEALRAVRAVRGTGGVRSLELEPRRRRAGPRVVLALRVARLGPDLVVVLADDRSEAARVDDVRRDFVANVSHELKTPVGALSLLAEAVEGAAEDPDAVLRFATRMQHEAARLSSMVNELIELSRLQGDEVGANPDVVPIDEVVAEALDSVRTAALAKQIDLRAAGQRGLVVEGVRAQLLTALRNLLDNAVNYSADRTRVVVSAHAVGERVEVSVADQGIGISAGDQERVFERFYRVDPARSRATGGTGLGLSIVKHVCANHGGDVVVWSTEGAGSTFTLRLPVRAHPVPDEVGVDEVRAEPRDAVRPVEPTPSADIAPHPTPVGGPEDLADAQTIADPAPEPHLRKVVP